MSDELQNRERIYVYMPEEATDTWRPVWAERLSADTYRIDDAVPDGELWEFQPGDIVRAQMQRFSGSTNLCAFEPADDASTRRRDKWRSVLKNARSVLISVWHPIGCAAPEDEYEFDALTITGMLLRNCDAKEVRDYLFRAEYELLGRVDVRRIEKTIEALLAFNHA